MKSLKYAVLALVATGCAGCNRHTAHVAETARSQRPLGKERVEPPYLATADHPPMISTPMGLMLVPAKGDSIGWARVRGASVYPMMTVNKDVPWTTEVSEFVSAISWRCPTGYVFLQRTARKNLTYKQVMNYSARMACVPKVFTSCTTPTREHPTCVR